MTCTSDRSGMASSGVLSREYIPAPTTNKVASNTRKRCRIDQLIIRSSMSVPLVAGGWCRSGVGSNRHSCAVSAMPAEAAERGFQVAFRVDQEIGAHHYVFAFS